MGLCKEHEEKDPDQAIHSGAPKMEQISIGNWSPTIRILRFGQSRRSTISERLQPEPVIHTKTPAITAPSSFESLGLQPSFDRLATT
jgi:hypothetical protein